MDKATLSRLQREGRMTEIMRGASLQHDGRTNLERNIIRYWYKLPGRHGDVFGISSARQAKRYSLAHLQIRDALAQRLDGARCLHTDHHRQRSLIRMRPGIRAVAHIDVDKINTGKSDLDDYLTACRLWCIYFIDFAGFRPTEGTNIDRFHLCAYKEKRHQPPDDD